ncbi:hypothetical protein GQ44DRAFT_361433 [Phaeosphaeriaceae sp. PMI808]|nr:hypothetical protein GQ44DRAFT_361433 [Phaeosphaeriaceae sp. PMI808]
MAVTLEIISGLCCLCTAIICGIRFYLRAVVARQDLWIEMPLIFALFLLLATLGVQIKVYSLLQHMDSVDTVILFGKLASALAYFYIFGLWAIKLSVNLLHIRLTAKFPTINAWAVRSLYAISSLFLISIIVYNVGCYPPRRWDGIVGKAKPCPMMVKEWDWWLITISHIVSDIWLCILPFAALRQIRERRLRIAVYGVYSLASASIIVSIIRTILLAVNPMSNIKTVMFLSVIEMSSTIIVGAVPCISSAFTSKYVARSHRSDYVSGRDDIIQNSSNRKYFSQLHEENTNQSANTNSIELSSMRDKIEIK